MDKKELEKKAEALVANGTLSAKQIEGLQDMDEGQLSMVKALVDALENAPKEVKEEVIEEVEEEVSAMEDDKDIDAVVANKVNEYIRRHEVVSKLAANEKNPFTADEMKAMPVSHLEKLEKSIRPADYSGQGGISTNTVVTEDVQPLVINRGLLTPSDKENK